MNPGIGSYLIRRAPATGRSAIPLRLLLLLVVAAALGLNACGDDVEGLSSGTTPAKHDDVAADAGYGSKCSPVSEDLRDQATRTIEVEAADYAFTPSTHKVGAGIVTFVVKNIGKEAHELALLPGGGEVPFTNKGAPDEDALSKAGAFELEAFPPAQDCTATYDLKPGTYTLFCIVEAADGKTHYEKGMAGTLTVH